MNSVPALYEHTMDVFNAMMKESKLVEIDGHKIRVYEGMLTKTVKNVGLSTPYYTATKGALEGMDCIRQLRRGGGSSPSQWMIVRAPTPELWQAAEASGAFDQSPSKQKDAAYEQQLRDLNHRLTVVERALGLAS